jgi:hypothetical protein
VEFDVSALGRLGSKFVAWLMKRDNQTLPSMLRDLTANFPLLVPEIAGAGRPRVLPLWAANESKGKPVKKTHF